MWSKTPNLISPRMGPLLVSNIEFSARPGCEAKSVTAEIRADARVKGHAGRHVDPSRLLRADARLRTEEGSRRRSNALASCTLHLECFPFDVNRSSTCDAAGTAPRPQGAADT